jgi:hypothetical protein
MIHRKGWKDARLWASLHEGENIGVNAVARDFWHNVVKEIDARKR